MNKYERSRHQGSHKWQKRNNIRKRETKLANVAKNSADHQGIHPSNPAKLSFLDEMVFRALHRKDPEPQKEAMQPKAMSPRKIMTRRGE